MKKHHLLALFSTVRLHQAQAAMDLRQVLEAGSLAAYAIANPDPTLSVTEDKNGLLNSSPKLNGIAYKWLDENYPQGSQNIKEMKDDINATTAHAKIRFYRSQFRGGGRRSFVAVLRLSRLDGVKTELWRIGNIGMSYLDLLYGVNQSVGSINSWTIFAARLGGIVERSNALRAEMMATDRYKAAMKAAEAAEESKGHHMTGLPRAWSGHVNFGGQYRRGIGPMACAPSFFRAPALCW